jgi:hypothetical protein
MRFRFLPAAAAVLLFAGCQEILLGPQPETSARAGFEILWKTIDENYALFPVKPVNWDSLHVVYASRLTSASTETDLWNAATGLLSKLDDGHVHIANGDFSKVFGSSHLFLRKADDFSLDLVKSRFLASAGVAGAGLMTYGMVRNRNIGYIHIASFTSNVGNGADWAYDIDRILLELRGTTGLIIDLRNNGGGLVVTLQIIASAIIDRPILYFYQRAKTGPKHNDFGPPISLVVSPRAGAPGYSGRIAVLTNRFSASGSEHITQIFRNLASVTQIGDTTFGAFGDIVNTAQLPNGWTFAYPCRLTTTPDGRCFEGIGLVPDVLVRNTGAETASGIDHVMDYAIAHLPG